jgi:hypothetical protein
LTERYALGCVAVGLEEQNEKGRFGGGIVMAKAEATFGHGEVEDEGGNEREQGLMTEEEAREEVGRDGV